MKFLENKGKRDIYICGDFNINLLKINVDRNTSDFVEMLFSAGLYPLIDKPTRITSHSATLIDNICTSEIHHNIQSGLCINDITDHLPIFVICDYTLNNNSSDQPFAYKRKLTDISIDKFEVLLNDVNWNDVCTGNCVDNCYTNFVEVFCKLYNEACPIKKIMIRKVKIKKPWLSKESFVQNILEKKNRFC